MLVVVAHLQEAGGRCWVRKGVAGAGVTPRNCATSAAASAMANLQASGPPGSKHAHPASALPHVVGQHVERAVIAVRLLAAAEHVVLCGGWVGRVGGGASAGDVLAGRWCMWRLRSRDSLPPNSSRWHSTAGAQRGHRCSRGAASPCAQPPRRQSASTDPRRLTRDEVAGHGVQAAAQQRAGQQVHERLDAPAGQETGGAGPIRVAHMGGASGARAPHLCSTATGLAGLRQLRPTSHCLPCRIMLTPSSPGHPSPEVEHRHVHADHHAPVDEIADGWPGKRGRNGR